MFQVEITQAGKDALACVAQWLENGAPHIDLNTGRVINSFDMDYGVLNIFDDEESCGTSCCIAGAVCQFENLGTPDDRGSLSFWGPQGVDYQFNKLCGLDKDDHFLRPLTMPWEFFKYTKEIFFGEEVDDCEASWLFNRPQDAALVIRHFLSTGVIDWSIIDGFVKTEPSEE